MSIRQRRIEADYLLVNGVLETMMTQFTAVDEKPGAKTTTKRYIGDASSTSTITSYESSCDLEGDQIKNDNVIKFLTSIGKERKTGEDTETEFYQVELDRPSNDGDNKFYCRKSTVSVEISEFPNNDGDLGLKGVLHYKGDPIVGTFDTTTKIFVEGFTDKTERSLKELSITYEEGTQAGKVNLTVSPELTTGNSYKYKVSSSAISIVLEQDCTLLDDLSSLTDVQATTGQFINLVEVDSSNKAVAFGTVEIS